MDRHGAYGRTRLRVVVAGGGVAALETILALRELAGPQVELVCLAPESTFVLRAATVAEPFERGAARRVSLDEFVPGQRVWLHRDALARVDADARVVTTAGGTDIAYDALVLAIGARATIAVPGSVTFTGPAEVEPVKRTIEDLHDQRALSVAFALPFGNTWPLPAYELALMTASELPQGSRSRVTVVTPEREPLEIFGAEASAAVRGLLTSRGIRLRTSAIPRYCWRGGHLVLESGERIPADRVVSLPALRGPHVVGVPSEGDGFIPVDEFGRVEGVRDVYAAGDATSFPVKQGGLAAQQADTVARHLAARAGADVTPERFAPVLRGVLFTGGVPLYLRAELSPTGESHGSATPLAASESSSSERPLWWPPAKVAGRLLGPYLSTARPSRLAENALTDRPPGSNGGRISEREHADAIELALMLADGDAEAGDIRSALRALDGAQALAGVLPPEYEAKRTRWLAAASH